jgi:hypothetical protein
MRILANLTMIYATRTFALTKMASRLRESQAPIKFRPPHFLREFTKELAQRRFNRAFVHCSIRIQEPDVDHRQIKSLLVVNFGPSGL